MQFKLKTLLLVTGGVSILAAAVAPWFRQLSELTQTRLMITLGVIGVANCFGCLTVALANRCERYQAGQCFTTIYGSKFGRWSNFVFWGLLALFNLGLLIWKIDYVSAKNEGVLTIIRESASPLAMLLYWPGVAAMHYRQSLVRLCEKGLIHHRFVPWWKIKSARIEKKRFVYVLTGHVRLDVPFQPTNRAGIELAISAWEAARLVPEGERQKPLWWPFLIQFWIFLLPMAPLLFFWLSPPGAPSYPRSAITAPQSPGP